MTTDNPTGRLVSNTHERALVVVYVPGSIEQQANTDQGQDIEQDNQVRCEPFAFVRFVPTYGCGTARNYCYADR